MGIRDVLIAFFFPDTISNTQTLVAADTEYWPDTNT